MASFTDLPREIIIMIFRELGHVKFLPALFLTCRHFFASFYAHPRVALEILRRHIPPILLPFAVAVLEASRLRRLSHALLVTDFLDALDWNPGYFAELVNQLSLHDLARLEHMHLAIHSFAIQFMNQAWSCLSQDDLQLSAGEHFRVCRAFYFTEIFYRAQEDMPDKTSYLFLGKFAPWEREQLGSIHDFLEKELLDTAFDVLAQDIEFGHKEFDYTRNGGGRDFRIQRWLMYGVLLVDRLLHANSPDTGRYRYVDLRRATQEEILRAAPHTGEIYHEDGGPFRAWCYARSKDPEMRVMDLGRYGLRRRAYVFWDAARLRKYDLLDAFDGVPKFEDVIREYLDEDGDGDRQIQAMKESWAKRSRIWNRGGRGRWSEGDTSRIIWPIDPAV